MKPTSTTTKLRAVFDASAQSSSGASLNDLLLPGPTVYAPLQDILLRFRQHRIGLTADVSKMFRIIELHPKDKDLHRFLWSTRAALNISLSNTFAWSDSTIVLSWLDGSSRKYKTFVGNRVACILNLLPPSTWHHVTSEHNPADCASRGLLPRELLNHHLWWAGPPWLIQPPDKWPRTPRTAYPDDILEVKASVSLAAPTEPWLTHLMTSSAVFWPGSSDSATTAGNQERNVNFPFT